jgi:predicted permease
MVVQALAMIGNLTIPLSLLSIGTQLGGLDVPVHHLSKSLWGLLATRLLIVPVIAIAIVAGLAKCGILIPDVPRIIGYLIVMMPVGISCSVIVERYQGDSNLAAQSIFYSTFFSLLTVPLIFYVVQRLGL